MPEATATASPPPGDERDKIRRRVIKNILRKIERGGTPTREEQRSLDAYYAAQPTKAGGPSDSSPPASPSDRQPSSYASMRQAASALHLPLGLLKKAKRMGCAAFQSNRVYRVALVEFIDRHRDELFTAGGIGLDGKKEEKLGEEIRKLRIRNDADEALSIKRAWVAERLRRMAGELNAIRSKSESEHPLKFAACGTNVDVARCRTIVRGIWDEILAAMSRLGQHLDEPSDHDNDEAHAA